MMESANTASAEPVAQPNNAAPESGAAPETSANEYVSKAEYDALMKRVEGQSAALGRMTSEISKMTSLLQAAPKTPEAPADGDPKAPVSTEYQALKAEMDRMKAREEKQRYANLRHTIRESLISREADPDLAELAVDAILSQRRESFIADDDERGNLSIRFRQADGVDVGIETWAEAYMASDKGQKILSAKRPPVGNGSTSRGSVVEGITYVDRKTLGRLTKEQLLSGKYQLRD